MRWLALGLAAFAAYWAPKVRGGKGGLMVNGDLVGADIWLVVWNIVFFHSVGNGIKIPTDELIFFRGVDIPPTKYYMFIDLLVYYTMIYLFTLYMCVYIIVYFYDNIYIYMYTCGDGSKPGRYHSFGDWTSYEPVNMDTHSWNGTYMGIVQAVGCKVRFKAFIYWFIFDYIESSTCFVDCWMFNSGSWNYLKGRWTIPFV